MKELSANLSSTSNTFLVLLLHTQKTNCKSLLSRYQKKVTLHFFPFSPQELLVGLSLIDFLMSLTGVFLFVFSQLVFRCVRLIAFTNICDLIWSHTVYMFVRFLVLINYAVCFYIATVYCCSLYFNARPNIYF